MSSERHTFNRRHVSRRPPTPYARTVQSVRVQSAPINATVTTTSNHPTPTTATSTSTSSQLDPAGASLQDVMLERDLREVWTRFVRAQVIADLHLPWPLGVQSLDYGRSYSGIEVRVYDPMHFIRDGTPYNTLRPAVVYNYFRRLSMDFGFVLSYF